MNTEQAEPQNLEIWPELETANTPDEIGSFKTLTSYSLNGELLSIALLRHLSRHPKIPWDDARGDEENGHYYLGFSDAANFFERLEDIPEGYHYFPIDRLGGVRQLSLIRYLKDGEVDTSRPATKHTRKFHTLVGTGIIGSMLRRNSFSQRDVELGEESFSLHDIATPAGGDATKSIDKDNLDEENHWQTVLDQDSLDYLLRKGFSLEEIDRIIHNDGPIGEALDWVDRISYTMTDAMYFVFEDPADSTNLYSILEEDPRIGDIYKTLEFDHETQEWYSTDPGKLDVFLRLRAVLFKDYYMHPINQGRDFLLAKLLSKHYSPDNSEEGKITPDILRSLTDEGLISYLSYLYGYSSPEAFYEDLLSWAPQHYEAFATEEEAQERAKEIGTDPNFQVVGVKHIPEFNPSTKFKVQGEWGKIYEFRAYYPEKAQGIEATARSVEGYYLYYEDANKPNPLVQKLAA